MDRKKAPGTDGMDHSGKGNGKRLLCNGIWFACWILLGVSLYYWHEEESWALFWWDVRSLLAGSPDFLAHGKKLMLCWLIGAAALLFFFWLRRRRKVQNLEWILAALLLTACLFYAALDGGGKAQDESWKEETLIAHALGSVDGNKGTNSLEAFEESYAAGYRVFEADMVFTEDNQLVLTHDWKKARKLQSGLPEDRTPTEEEFLNEKIYGQYTPLNFRDLCELMLAYPDIYVVTDSKYTESDKIEQEFQYMMTVIQELNGEKLLDRFIIQVYNQDMYEQIRGEYPFSKYLLTLYKLWEGDAGEFLKLCRWCASNHVDTITMRARFASEEILQIADRYGISVYVHTVNDAEEANAFLEIGVDGIYTDSLLQEDFAGSG